jgi:hypothetical protein
MKPPSGLLTGLSMGAVFADIRNGAFALKKAGMNREGGGKKISDKVLRTIDTSKKVPSLEEIQVALKKLRQISKQTNV